MRAVNVVSLAVGFAACNAKDDEVVAVPSETDVVTEVNAGACVTEVWLHIGSILLGPVGWLFCWCTPTA